MSEKDNEKESRVWGQVQMPLFHVIDSGPTISISEIKRRRFNLIDREEKKFYMCG